MKMVETAVMTAMRIKKVGQMETEMRRGELALEGEVKHKTSKRSQKDNCCTAG